MTSLYNMKELTSRIAREETAARKANCDRSRKVHLDLAMQYRFKAAEIEGIKEVIRISIG